MARSSHLAALAGVRLVPGRLAGRDRRQILGRLARLQFLEPAVIWGTAANHGIAVGGLQDTWADTTTPHGRLMLTVLGGLAEFERELIPGSHRRGLGRPACSASASTTATAVAPACPARRVTRAMRQPAGYVANRFPDGYRRQGVAALMADRWQAKLSRPIVTGDGTRLATPAEASALILALSVMTEPQRRRAR
jgi:hypothetical protein